MHWNFSYQVCANRTITHDKKYYKYKSWLWDLVHSHSSSFRWRLIINYINLVLIRCFSTSGVWHWTIKHFTHLAITIITSLILKSIFFLSKNLFPIKNDQAFCIVVLISFFFPLKDFFCFIFSDLVQGSKDLGSHLYRFFAIDMGQVASTITSIYFFSTSFWTCLLSINRLYNQLIR